VDVSNLITTLKGKPQFEWFSFTCFMSLSVTGTKSGDIYSIFFKNVYFVGTFRELAVKKPLDLNSLFFFICNVFVCAQKGRLSTRWTYSRYLRSRCRYIRAVEFLIKFYNFIYPYNNSSYQSHRKSYIKDFVQNLIFPFH
jgi:hypothetical protein